MWFISYKDMNMIAGAVNNNQFMFVILHNTGNIFVQLKIPRAKKAGRGIFYT